MKHNIKRFLKIFALVFLIESVVAIACILGQQFMDTPFSTILVIIVYIISLPIMLLDRTYPFYAMGTGYFQISLYLINILAHSIIVFLILRKAKPKSTNILE